MNAKFWKGACMMLEGLTRIIVPYHVERQSEIKKAWCVFSLTGIHAVIQAVSELIFSWCAIHGTYLEVR